MCYVCVDEAVVAIGIIAAGCPWYKTIWFKVKAFFKRKNG